MRQANCSHSYLMPAIVSEIAKHPQKPRRVFDLGCGPGDAAALLTKHGYDVVGVDPDITEANAAFPELRLETGSGYDALGHKYGRFPFVISMEVIEHVIDPRLFVRTLYDLLEPEGVAVITTPYHGYLKNLALALTGRMDQHFTALWDGGHIKFWSEKTLRILLEEAGFENIEFKRTGRIKPFAKSMIAIATRP